MVYVGLTGGICSGKSLVARYFEELGCGVIDLDALSRKVSQPNQPAYQQIIDRFGNNILQGDGVSIDRRKLRRLIFHDPIAKTDLENIVLPALRQAEAEIVGEMTRNNNGKGVIVTHGATIIETGWYEKYDKIVVVSTTTEIQLARLMARDNLTESDARKSIQAQPTNEERERFAHFIIQNHGDGGGDGGTDELRRRVAEVYDALVRK